MLIGWQRKGEAGQWTKETSDTVSSGQAATSHRVNSTISCLLLLSLAVGIGLFGLSASAIAGDTTATKASSSAKSKSLAKCKKIRAKQKRKTCLSRVSQRFMAPVRVDVRDDYFVPENVSIRSGRRIVWDWGTINGNSHNVMLDPYALQPKSLTRSDFFRLDSGQNYAINHRFTRDLVKAGEYNFYCSLHSTVMRMKVKVIR